MTSHVECVAILEPAAKGSDLWVAWMTEAHQ